jgi:hypothetical protein
MRPSNALRSKILVLVCLFGLTSFSAAQTVLSYAEETRADVSSFQLTRQESGGMVVWEFRSAESRSTIRASGNSATAMISSGPGGVSEIERDGDQLVFLRSPGIVGNETLIAPIDADPWVGSFYLIGELLDLSQRRTAFFVVNPDEREVMKMIAIPQGRERIESPVGTVTTLKVRVTLPGIMGLAWHSDYWFRVDDGVMVKAAETRGRPGTPTTYITLVGESGG